MTGKSKSVSEKPCLVTVTDAIFLPGTLVMIHSFLKTNRWFQEADGDIVIIHDCLSQQWQERFHVFKNIVFLQVGELLKEKVEMLCRSVPGLKLESRKKRFYSLDLFRLKGYRNVLFCDSDILFLGDVSGLFHPLQPEDPVETNPLMGVGDLYYFSDTALDSETFMPPTIEKATVEQNQLIKNTFNAGFLIIDRSYLSAAHYNNLLDLLDPQRWSHITSPRTDQVILNLYFKDRCRMLSACYNYLILHADLINKKENIAIEDIKVLHFNGKAKPWDCIKILDFPAFIPSMIKFIKLWHREYLDFLARYHLHHRLKLNSKPTDMRDISQ